MIKATMKIYPVKERKDERWSKSQSMRLITIRIMNGEEKPDKKTANIVFQKLLKMGYGALDYNTHQKVVRAEDLNKEQINLNKIFDLTLIM